MRYLSLVFMVLLSLVSVAARPAPVAAQDNEVVAAFEGAALGEIEELDGGITDRNAPESDPTVSTEDLEEYVEQIFLGSTWMLLEDGDLSFEFGPKYDLTEFGLDDERATLTGTWDEENSGAYSVEIENTLDESEEGYVVTARLNAEIDPDDEPIASVEYVQRVDLITETSDVTTSYFYELEVELRAIDPDEAGEDQNGGDEGEGLYTSPNYGYTLTYDPDEWQVEVEDDDPDDESDRVALGNGTSRIALISHPLFNAESLDACLQSYSDAIEDDEDIQDVEVLGERDAEGEEEARVWTTYTYVQEDRSGGEVAYVTYVECRALTDDLVVTILHLVSAEEYEDEVEAREELLEGLAPPDSREDDPERDEDALALPDDPNAVVISVSVNTGSLPPEYQAGYYLEIAADGDVKGEVFPEGSLADEPTAELEEVDVALGEDGLLELLTEMDELGFFDLPQADDADIPAGGSVHYLRVELADGTWEVSMYSLDSQEQQETFENVLVLIEETVNIERPDL